MQKIFETHKQSQFIEKEISRRIKSNWEKRKTWIKLRSRDLASGKGRREKTLKQEKSSKNVQETYNYGCIPEGELQPPWLSYLHLLLFLNGLVNSVILGLVTVIVLVIGTIYMSCFTLVLSGSHLTQTK